MRLYTFGFSLQSILNFSSDDDTFHNYWFMSKIDQNREFPLPTQEFIYISGLDPLYCFSAEVSNLLLRRAKSVIMRLKMVKDNCFLTILSFYNVSYYNLLRTKSKEINASARTLRRMQQRFALLVDDLFIAFMYVCLLISHVSHSV